MATEEIAITIEIVCTELPGTGHNALHLGIQRDEEIIEAATADSKRIVFRPTLRARRNADGSVNFLGPFAQGPKTERFIYLNWASTAAVEKGAERDKPIRVELALTNAKGNPVMASVRPDVAKWELP